MFVVIVSSCLSCPLRASSSLLCSTTSCFLYLFATTSAFFNRVSRSLVCVLGSAGADVSLFIFVLSFSLSFVVDFLTVLVVAFATFNVLSGDTERVGLAFLSVDVVEGLSLGTALRSRPTWLLSLVLVESLLSTLSLLLELSLLDFLGTSLVVAVLDAVLVFLAGDVDLARALVSEEAVVVDGARLGTADFEAVDEVVEEVMDMIVGKGYHSRGMRRSIMGRGLELDLTIF